MKSLNKKLKAYFLKIRRDEILALDKAEKNLFLNFEPYDLAICMMDVYKILYTPFHTSLVRDPTVKSV